MPEFLHAAFILVREHRSVFLSAGLCLVFEKNKAKISSWSDFMSSSKRKEGNKVCVQKFKRHFGVKKKVTEQCALIKLKASCRHTLSGTFEQNG